MKISDKTINERRVFAEFNESELEELLIKMVANQSGFKMDRNTKTKVIIEKVDKGVGVGFQSQARVTLVNNLSE